MARFSVDLEVLDATVVRLGAYVEYLEDKLGALDQRVASLRDDWTGDAADAHSAAHIEWTAGSRQMREGVDAMRRVAQTAHASYQLAVAANLRMFGP
nr:WXG100 family type VII secretion target [Rhodococcus sp. (in: high G+C Gram-positive bacteria)]